MQVGRKNNKFYAMQNRRRKKEYVKELEEKVQNLENTIVDLNNEIAVYKHKMFSIAWGGEAHFTDFESLREAWRYRIEEMTQNKEKENGFKQFEEVKDAFGPMGSARRLMIKKWFRTIIENLVPNHIKLVMSIAPNLSTIEDEEYDKLFSLPKPAAYHKLKTEEYTEADKTIYEIGIRGNLRKAFRIRSSLLKDVKSQMKYLVNHLIMIQNRIFQEQNKMKEVSLYI